MTVLDKRDREAFEEEEEHAVEETLIESYEDEDGFRAEEYYKFKLATWTLKICRRVCRCILLQGLTK